MILIADSGATKTDWVIIEEGHETHLAQTNGLNPYFIDYQGIEDELQKNLYPHLDNKHVTEVYFYGAGCANLQNCDVVKMAMEDFFVNAAIYIEHDLLGAARSLLGHTEGIAGILGTGSNSCYYDGTEIIQNVPSLGYVLADEGSGAYMGRLLIRDYFFGKLPPKIKEAFDQKYGFSLDNILNAIYHEKKPNQYLASYTYFLSEHKQSTHIHKLIKSAFSSFFKYQVSQYSRYQEIPFSATGSIAYYFKDILSEVAEKYGVKLGKITQSPLQGLISYHSTK